MSSETNPDVPRILCVDDEPSILNSLKRVLRRDGYEIVLAEGGQAALDALWEHEFACVICDQRMPDIDGPTVLTACYEKQPDAYRITLTGFTDITAAQRSINAGRVNLFLTKPWDEQGLRQAVSEGIKQSQLVRENRKLQALTVEQNKQLADWNQTLEQRVEQRTQEVRKRSEQALTLLRQIEVTLDDAVGMMTSLLEMLDPAAASHAKRVAALAGRLAYWVQMDDRQQKETILAARLHEIGKLSVLGCHLRGEEDAVRRLPPVRDIGYGMLSRVSGFRKIAEAVRDQDEWFDGKGPDSHAGRKDVSLAARIIHTANAYDQAVYARGDVTRPDTMAGKSRLEDGCGTEFDPKLVDLLLDHVKASGMEPESMDMSVFEASAGMVVLDDIKDVDERLLLKKGTVLDREMVMRLRRLAKGGQIDSVLVISTVRASASSQPPQAA